MRLPWPIDAATQARVSMEGRRWENLLSLQSSSTAEAWRATSSLIMNRQLTRGTVSLSLASPSPCMQWLRPSPGQGAPEWWWWSQAMSSCGRTGSRATANAHLPPPAARHGFRYNQLRLPGDRLETDRMRHGGTSCRHLATRSEGCLAPDRLGLVRTALVRRRRVLDTGRDGARAANSSGCDATRGRSSIREPAV